MRCLIPSVLIAVVLLPEDGGPTIKIRSKVRVSCASTSYHVDVLLSLRAAGSVYGSGTVIGAVGFETVVASARL
jgi:hypothetical protein